MELNKPSLNQISLISKTLFEDKEVLKNFDIKDFDTIFNIIKTISYAQYKYIWMCIFKKKRQQLYKILNELGLNLKT